MQKAIKRAAQARLQTKRRADRVFAKNKREEMKAKWDEHEYLEAQRFDLLRAERRERREDWMMGPLAPNRDAGLDQGVYGTLNVMRFNPATPLKPEKFVNFMKGDRVAIMAGPDKGKIGEVQEVTAEKEVCTIVGMNLYDLRMPKHAINDQPDKAKWRTHEAPVKFSDLRLVVPLTNAETGITEDVVVEKIRAGAPYERTPYGYTRPAHTRYIDGMKGVVIPWPAEEPVEYPDEDPDTLRIDVETQTYEPSLLSYPMPDTVISELRNPHSKYRTKRLDPAKVERLEYQDRVSEWTAQRTAVTPKQQLMDLIHQKKAEERQRRKKDDGNWIVPKETMGFINGFLKEQRQAFKGQKNTAAV